MHVLVSGPQGRRNHVRDALKAAGFSIVDLDNPHGYSPSHEVEWTGARYQQGDIDVLNDESPEHGKVVGDIVAETGQFVPKEVKHSVCFICVEREDDRAMDAVQPIVDEHNWHLRAHWTPSPPVPKPPLAEVLARLDIDSTELRAFLGVK